MWVTRSLACLGCNLGWLGLCLAVSQVFGGSPARAESGPAKADAVASATNSSTGNGCLTTRAAMAATGWGRSTMIRPASLATTPEAAAALGP